MSLVCLFDVDGTLVDSGEPLLTALNAALADHQQAPITVNGLRRHVGPPLRDSLTTLLTERHEDPGLVESLLSSFRDHYAATSVAMARSYEGIPELLGHLQPHVRMGVVTSKPIPFARPILEKLGFDEFMEVIEGPTLAEMEPKTETLARALRLLNQAGTPARFVMIGDRSHDIEAAHVNGIDSIGVTWGFGTTEELAEAGAGRIVSTPEQLAGLLTS